MRKISVLTMIGFLTLGVRAELVQYTDMARVAQRPEVVAFEAQLASAAGDADALHSIAQSIETKNHSPMVRDHLRVATINYLALARPTPPVSQWLQQLAQRPVLIHVAHEHDGHITPIPAYDPAAAARYALARHARQAVADAIRASLDNGNGLAQAILQARAAKARGPAESATYVDVVQNLDRAVLAREIAALSSGLAARPELGAALIVAARRLQRPSLLATVIADGTAADARDALGAAKDIDATFDHVPLIRAAIARPETSAAGLQALARAAAEDPGLTPELLGYLRRPDLSRAAAAAIAAHASADLVPWLSRQLEGSTDADLATALALTLSLIPEPEARAALLAWSERPGALDALRRKIRQAYSGRVALKGGAQ